LSPSSFTVQGSSATLTVNGANFATGDTVRWQSPNGIEIALPTTFVSSSQLTAAVDQSLLTQTGTVHVTVRRNAVLASTTSLLVVPNIPTTLGAIIVGRSGPSNARAWTIQFTDNGPGVATGVQISSMSLTQTAGTACTPAVISLPSAIASIPVGASANASVTIDFSSCTGTVRFKVIMPFTANGGVMETMTEYNQVP
jgi:hypothetical protein